MPVLVVHQSIGDAVVTAFASAMSLLLGGIPRIIAFLVILIVGWIIAAIVSRVITSVLHAVKFNDMAQRSGLAGFVRDMGVTTDASGALAGIVKWFIRLIFLVAAFDALGLPAVSAVLQQFLLWIPNLIVALVVLVIGGLLAKALSSVVRGASAEAQLGNPDLMANIARIAVMAFAIIIAVNQIGIASTLVNTLFMGFVAMFVIAFGLAFGLGGRDVAAQITQKWYAQSQQAAPKMSRAASAAQGQAQATMNQVTPVGGDANVGRTNQDGSVTVEQRRTTRS